ncbi:MAG TPA: hypothetical protein DIT03_11170 [Candidatus Accumulibacter sp.]|nr:hypothetical protein [Accumulibacter sp.]HCN68801.1 hypothetical protein [Accumulibacter sp.]
MSNAEIDACVASTAAALARDRAEAAARRDALKRELAAGNLPLQRKMQAEREFAIAGQSLEKPFYVYYHD